MKGIIYKIECCITGEVYYGSTQQSLNLRMIGHKSDYKRWKQGTFPYMTSFQIIERCNYSYSLIETIDCEDKKQLEIRERFFIENNKCINKNIPGRTTKEYYESNKEARLDYQKQYYESNKQLIIQLRIQRYLKQKQSKELLNNNKFIEIYTDPATRIIINC